MVEMAKFIKPILGIVPPDLTGFDLRQLTPLTGLLRAFQKLPEKQQAVFVQLMTMSAADFLRQWFETDPLIATMSASGIIGTYQGVQSPGTAYVLLHHYMGEIDGAFRAWGIPRGGTGGVSSAIGGAARALGAEIRTAAPVARIDVRGGHAVGVTLESGEEIRARTVLELGGRAADLPRAARARCARPGVRGGGPSVQVPGLLGQGQSRGRPAARLHLPARRRATICAARSASAPASTTWSGPTTTPSTGTGQRRPYIDMIIPTLVDPSMAPPGKHVISCFVQYAPVQAGPSLGSWDDNREAFGDAVIDRSPRSPPTSGTSSCTGRSSPRSTSSDDFGLTEGNIFQGELSLEQLFFNRPVPGYARFRTPRQGPVAVRLVDPPGRRDHGRARSDRRDGAPQGTRPEGAPDDGPDRVRRDRRRRRPQRPGRRRLPGSGRASASLVLERRDRVGGAGRHVELAPGRKAPALAHTVGRLRPSVVRDLGLRAHGLSLVGSGCPRRSRRSPTAAAITLWGDPARTAEGLRASVRARRRRVRRVRPAGAVDRPASWPTSAPRRRPTSSRRRSTTPSPGSGSGGASAVSASATAASRPAGPADGRRRLRRRGVRDRRAAGGHRRARRPVHGDGPVVGRDRGGPPHRLGRQRRRRGRADRRSPAAARARWPTRWRRRRGRPAARSAPAPRSSSVAHGRRPRDGRRRCLGRGDRAPDRRRPAPIRSGRSCRPAGPGGRSGRRLRWRAGNIRHAGRRGEGQPGARRAAAVRGGRRATRPRRASRAGSSSRPASTTSSAARRGEVRPHLARAVSGGDDPVAGRPGPGRRRAGRAPTS